MANFSIGPFDMTDFKMTLIIKTNYINRVLLE